MRSVAYLCGVWPERQLVGGTDDVAAARHELHNWIDRYAPYLWPRQASTRSLTEAPPGGAEPSPPAPTFLRVNRGPADRYVLSTAGSTKYRIRPDASGFANLWLAGDWTHTELNVGCVEAAVQSGRLAADSVLARHT